ncbi:MAG: aminotransferase class V-fold PLP-dependent enzyme [Gemmatimonadaceae bacterium]|nr:aminotransferase class V-fold PLP-dependent enzyme [Chitinophagaceae bacterium]
MVIHPPNTQTIFETLRKTEYSRLDSAGHIYLDFTASNLYPYSLVDRHCCRLQREVFGNPHSNSPTSQFSGRLISQARKRVTEFFNGENYHCIFTSNASAALELVGQSYPFTPDSALLLTTDNHNSVNGLREYCRAKGGSFKYAPLNPADLSIDLDVLRQHFHIKNGSGRKLFAYPAQSNATGIKHPLSLIAEASALGWDVLLDAAAFVPTAKLDLEKHPADFVSLSFYKMFGYPTGIGCLLVRKDKFQLLRKTSFAGGTVEMASVNQDFYRLLDGPEKFENGTVNFLGIPAVTDGLDFLENIGMEKISSRTCQIADRLIVEMNALVHDNGTKLIRAYGTQNRDRGGTILFNILHQSGNPQPLEIVEEHAMRRGISLRTGCFCNPGVDETINQHDPTRQRGAIRISAGLPTNGHDIQRFINFLETFLNQ